MNKGLYGSSVPLQRLCRFFLSGKDALYHQHLNRVLIIAQEEFCMEGNELN